MPTSGIRKPAASGRGRIAIDRQQAECQGRVVRRGDRRRAERVREPPRRIDTNHPQTSSAMQTAIVK